jgi:hypothetical protein
MLRFRTSGATPHGGHDARGTALNELASLPRLRIYATEPSVLGAQSVELTLQDDDAVTERGETSVHVELPGLKDWRLRVEVCALLCVFG